MTDKGYKVTNQTIIVTRQSPVLTITFNRPTARNAITQTMISACRAALDDPRHADLSIVVWRGNAESFCVGADFSAHGGVAENSIEATTEDAVDAVMLYELWQSMLNDRRIHVAAIEGQASGGGIGFVSACDISLASMKATFSLPELLFGLFPACVLPFLSRRIGWQAAHVMTLTTKPINTETALAKGLIDECDTDLNTLLRKLLVRLRHLDSHAISRYKSFAGQAQTTIEALKYRAIEANQALFSDPQIQQGLRDFKNSGHLPFA